MTKTLIALSSVVLAAALAGCSGGAGASPSATTTSAQDDGRKFAKCMREHGIDMKDPKPGGGPTTFKVQKKDAGKFEAAQKACKAYAPTMDGPGTMSAQELDRLTKLAQCLRRNGVDAADPKPGQPFQIKSRKGNAAKTDAAMKTCEREVGLPHGGPKVKGQSNTSGGSGE